MLKISISDNGIGIPLDIQDKVFDPFFTTKDLQKGTGIGLSMVNTTIQDMGGRVEFESIENIGTCFTVYLPYFEDLSVGREGAEETSSLGLSKKRKLSAVVVDDEADICEYVQNILLGLGFTVDLAEDGEEAMTLVNSKNYDLVISDIKMPRKNGIELFEEIRRSEKQLKRPFLVLMTGGVNIEFEKIELVSDKLILKPFTKTDIYRAIESWFFDSRPNKKVS